MIDAYGKLLEEKLKQQEVSEEEKKKKEEKDAALNVKKHELEMAKLDYEIQKLQYQKAPIEDEWLNFKYHDQEDIQQASLALWPDFR